MKIASDQKTTNSEPSLFGVSTISEDLVIVGNVNAEKSLHIDGRVRGDVRCASLVLGENSHLEGNVVAEEVVIRGRLLGSVRALKIILQSTSHVKGELHHQELSVKHGAYFDGTSRCSDDPLSQHSNGSLANEAKAAALAAASRPTDS